MTLKIRTWSLIAVSSALLPLIILFIFTLLHIARKEQALVETELQYRTIQIVQATNERLAVAVQALQVLSNSPSARNGDWPALHEHARRLVSSNADYLAVTLVDETDNLLFVTALPYGEKTFKANYVNLVHEVFKTGRPNVSGPFIVPIAQGHRIAISVPIVRGDKITHVLRMILSTDSISAIIRQQHLPDNWLAAIADKEGTLIARSTAEKEYAGKPASASFIAAIYRKDHKIFKGVSLEGSPITSMVFPIFHGDWYAAIAVPDHVLKGQYQHTIFVLLLMSLCAAFLGISAAFAGARFMAKQARKLESAVESRSTGKSPRIISPGIAEFSNIYRCFCGVVEKEEKTEICLKQVTTEKDEISDLYEHAPCGYHSLDSDGCFVRINQTELEWLGKTRDEVIGQPFKNFITESGKAVFDKMFPEFLADGHVKDLEFYLICSDGSTKPVLVTATLIRDADGKAIMSRSIVFDITERKKLEKKLEDLSNNDSLTGLCNRRHFYELAAREVERALRLKSPFALAILDVDHFKLVNDQFGHAIGDKLLAALGKTLKEKMRAIDIVARIGGEEFAVLMPQTELDNATLVLDRLREHMAAIKIVTDDGRSAGFTVSIGVTVRQANEVDIDATLSRADGALYDAKRSGRNKVCSA